ncbi:hypothetical protein M2277_003070 [Paenibacillus sp. LBL]|uniref:hypothetical protein n=1 Tax=Paenibacillus sp. LBL TaxID=2940563 RepID=UPI002473CA6D|nr:hypothetical protein [Paenibacillus sp. LBL]MDH6672408.1 hypothetical protein [Paenibacillus sp. LBL]
MKVARTVRRRGKGGDRIKPLPISIDLAILFTAIFFPLFLIVGMRSESLEDVRYVEMKYTAALRTAVQDGGMMLNDNETQAKESAYDSLKFMRADKEKALDSFARTLYVNMGIAEDTAAQAALWWYIPAMVVLDYDGYYLYVSQTYSSEHGEEIMQHRWTPKIPYAWTDDTGNSIRFTLDSFVHVFESGPNRWQSGFRKDLIGETGVALLDDEDMFEQVRRITIMNTIQDQLAYYIQRHNQIALRNGISYTFTLPLISREDWVNTIDDIGIMAFIQGIPVGDQYYNNYALGGGRLVKAPVYFGGIDSRGLKYYYRDACQYNYRVEEVFPNAKEAAAAGYQEKSCYNPGVM